MSTDSSQSATTTAPPTLEQRVAALEAKTASMSVVNKDVVFTGVNVQVVSGTGTTQGPVNGKGNLIVGYNEIDNPSQLHTGSHNIITGVNQTYTSYGGLIAGVYNAIKDKFASVTGGQGNTVKASSAIVVGGLNNTATAALSVVPCCAKADDAENQTG